MWQPQSRYRPDTDHRRRVYKVFQHPEPPVYGSFVLAVRVYRVLQRNPCQRGKQRPGFSDQLKKSCRRPNLLETTSPATPAAFKLFLIYPKLRLPAITGHLFGLFLSKFQNIKKQYQR